MARGIKAKRHITNGCKTRTVCTQGPMFLNELSASVLWIENHEDGGGSRFYGTEALVNMGLSHKYNYPTHLPVRQTHLGL